MANGSPSQQREPLVPKSAFVFILLLLLLLVVAWVGFYLVLLNRGGVQ